MSTFKKSQVNTIFKEFNLTPLEEVEKAKSWVQSLHAPFFDSSPIENLTDNVQAVADVLLGVDVKAEKTERLKKKGLL